MKAVVQETGLKADTLRAWERRYNLPQPDRTDGGHRLYSRRDIETLKWLINRQDEGMSISHAVELWNRLLTEGKDPLKERAGKTLPPLSGRPQQVITSGTTMTQLRESWVQACLDFDEHTAEAALTQAFALYSPENVCLELLQKGLAEVGRGWYEGTTTVQQEHFASALALRRLEALVAAAPRPTRSERILIGCPPHEEHTFIPLLFNLLLRRRGWDVIYLGANVPVERLETTIKTTRPEIAIFPAQQLHTAAALPEIAEVLAEEGIPLAFGGRIFLEIPELKERIRGHYLGDTTDVAVQVIEKVILNGRKPADVPEPSPNYARALTLFTQQQALIELTTWQILKDQGVPYAHVVNANLHLARNIAAALKLGEMHYLGSEIDWVRGLIDNYGIDAAYLQLYMDAYFLAVKQHLGREAQPIVDWLSQFQAA
jgi:DNA-binding transcriptional MerR regulator